jgi:hypothetical protein
MRLRPGEGGRKGTENRLVVVQPVASVLQSSPELLELFGAQSEETETRSRNTIPIAVLRLVLMVHLLCGR